LAQPSSRQPSTCPRKGRLRDTAVAHRSPVFEQPSSLSTQRPIQPSSRPSQSPSLVHAAPVRASKLSGSDATVASRKQRSASTPSQGPPMHSESSLRKQPLARSE